VNTTTSFMFCARFLSGSSAPTAVAYTSSIEAHTKHCTVCGRAATRELTRSSGAAAARLI
jgi:hypothetical protein